MCTSIELARFTYVELVSLNKVSIKIICNRLLNLPFMVNRLDIEAQSGADSIDVFTHNFLDYSRLPSIVKATMRMISNSLQDTSGFLTALESSSPYPLIWLSVISITFCRWLKRKKVWKFGSKKDH